MAHSDTNIDTLLQRVYADSGSDEPRHALASALCARSDPLGEFVTLQLQASRTREESRQVRRLLKAHAKTWLRPLQGALVAKTVKWERGFPVSGRVAFHGSRAKTDALIGIAALATLRQLDVAGANVVHDADWLQRFLFESPLRGLHTLQGVQPWLFPRFLRADPPWALRRLAFAGHAPQSQLSEVADACLDAPGLPGLVDLQLSYVHKRPGAADDDLWWQYDIPGNYRWLWTTELGRRLRVLRMNHEPSGAVPWMNVLAERSDTLALERIVLFTTQSFALERTAAGWTQLTGTLPRDPPGRLKSNLDGAIVTLRRHHTLDVDIDGYQPPPSE